MKILKASDLTIDYAGYKDDGTEVDAVAISYKNEWRSWYAKVKTAHWIINSDGYYPQCSNCMREPESGKMTEFCPHCGAKIDESEESSNE